MRLQNVRSLKRRMTIYLSLVLIISMTISTVIASVYFINVASKQYIQSEEVKLQQIARQLEYKVNDISHFANSVAVDHIIQNELKKTSYKNELTRLKSKQKVAEQLSFYSSLRSYTHTVTIVGSNGNTYNNRKFHTDEYVENKLKAPALAAYVGHPQSIFSSPYTSNESNVSTDVICYRVTIRDIQNPSQEIGVAYFEILFKHFLQDVLPYAENHRGVLWHNETNDILYLKNGKVEEQLLQPSNEDVKNLQGEYLIRQHIPMPGWTILLFLSRQDVFQQTSFVLVFFTVFFLSTLGFIILTLHPILSHIVRPIATLTKVMKTVREGNLSVRPQTETKDEISLLYAGFNEMLDDIESYIQQTHEYEKNKKKLEFDILLSQINPHYLYNVLNTIVYLAAEEGHYRIVEIVNAQIHILQEYLKVGEDIIFTTVQEEISVIQSYLTIQRYRYPDLFTIDVDIDPSLLNVPIPKTILQPLIENALFHGIVPKDVPGLIKLHIYKQDDFVALSVWDNGVGMEKEQIQQLLASKKMYSDGRKHIGLLNIQERIAFLYNGASSFSITSTPNEYTLVTIKIPLHNGNISMPNFDHGEA